MNALFSSLETWSVADCHDEAALADAGITGELAALLSEVGSGTLDTAHGGRYHLLDPAGVAYWSREVLERLQGVCQPAGLRAFFIDDGGGTYAFVCSNGVYTLHHQRGLLARYEDIASFFRRALASAEPFEAVVSEPREVEQSLRRAEMEVAIPLDARLAGKPPTVFRPYDPHVRWAEGDLMIHRDEGRGIVTAVKTTMYIQVEFAGGRKTLAHKGW